MTLHFFNKISYKILKNTQMTVPKSENIFKIFVDMETFTEYSRDIQMNRQ